MENIDFFGGGLKVKCGELRSIWSLLSTPRKFGTFGA